MNCRCCNSWPATDGDKLCAVCDDAGCTGDGTCEADGDAGDELDYYDDDNGWSGGGVW